jgi:hypothetical protein
MLFLSYGVGDRQVMGRDYRSFRVMYSEVATAAKIPASGQNPNIGTASAPPATKARIKSSLLLFFMLIFVL